VDGFIQMTHDWVNFFGALAQISGALVGLVFVALTFNSKTLGLNGDPLLGALARQTFADFLLLLVISMLMLMPYMTANTLRAVLLILVAFGLARILYSLFQLRAHLHRRKILQRFVPSAAGHLCLGWVGIQLVRGATDPRTTGLLLFSGVVLLMLSGCRSAWLLVLHEQP